VHHDINFEAITNLMHKYLYSYNTTVLYIFRALLCSSSWGSTVYVQHLAPSLSVSGRAATHKSKYCFIKHGEESVILSWLQTQV